MARAICTTPFDKSNELLAGPEWTRKFILACRARGFNQEQQDAIIWHGTGERQTAARGVRCDEVMAMRETWRRVVAGLADPAPDGALVFEVTKRKTRTVPAKYRLVGVVIALAAHAALVDKHFPGTRAA